jgi:hypothetical protein
MDETAVSEIQEYIDTYLFEPKQNWPEHCFVERSYSRWAAYFIKERIMEESLRLPAYLTGREHNTSVDIVLEFMDDMDYYLCSGSSKRSSLIFSTARRTAEDILNFIS